MAEENKELTREQEGALEAEREDAAPAGQEPEEEKEPETLEGMLYCWAQALITAVVSVVLLFTFAVRLIGVSGPSMQDTLYTGDRLLVLNSILCGDYQSGDVVVINDYNAELSDTLVKRIIAVGGQTVDIDFSTGTVYVDGQELDEPYIKEPTYTTDGTVFPLTLAEDEVLVMGDNRNSPKLGPVKRGYLQGKAVFLLMPGRTPDTDKSDWSRVGVVR